MHVATRGFDRLKDVSRYTIQIVVLEDDVRLGHLVENDPAALRVERLPHVSILPTSGERHNWRLGIRP